ncbi:hypothetical protein FisN_13Lh229 [Fistulifera solaris]|uniref:Chromo domain-containing protein n=1 Tax=Fistulifera solaris TaxID=1519565 RepID=A0A1Z5KM61_FISSO|nr:hypothetical protein FisN_13Lh229 [Fistulifera solaris]|eukprot:GAX27215.1 hypothetical protein FisN_13Lh229 [Fistulifera solaris]
MPSKRTRSSTTNKKDNRKKKKSSGKIVASDDDGEYFEIETILDHRNILGVEQFLIKWVDYDEPTWEAEEALCDSAYDMAMSLKQEKTEGSFLANTNKTNATETLPMNQSTSQKKYSDNDEEEEDDDEEEEVIAEPVEEGDEIDDEATEENGETEEGSVGFQDVADTTIDWADSSQIEYRPIERISVHAEGVAQRVKAAREAGVPLCLVGHVGWTQFAKPWLSKVSKDNDKPDGGIQTSARNPRSTINEANHEDSDAASSGETTATLSDDGTSDSSCPNDASASANSTDEKLQLPKSAATMSDDFLDLAQLYVVDVQKMVDSIGSESVPIQRKGDKLGDDPNQYRVSLKFFVEKCWPEPGKELAPAMAARYLHQWQFPLSSTAVPKLCNQCNPLPHAILGLDLLRLWHDREQFLGDSPYQYLFMGNKGTMSKLHSDRGGLMITIAPIVGEKEVVLVHRSDVSSLYDLEGGLEKPDLHHFPLLPTARVWKTVIKPGEILIIPHSTYHQCRNVTPCLSYSRFYLDDVNIKAFLQSLIDCDAPDLDHDDLLWNVCVELHFEVTNYSDKVRAKWIQDGTIEETPLSIVNTVTTLRSLRNAARHVEIHFIQVDDKAHEDWKKMVIDIDNTLHNYRYRYFRRQPRVSRKVCRHTKEQQHEVALASALPQAKAPFNCPLNLFCNQLKISPDNEGVVLPDSVTLNPGDHLGVKDHGYYFEGVIKEVKHELKAAYVKFLDFTDYCSQHVPFEYLRSDVSDEAFPPSFSLLNGSLVCYKESDRSYQARIQSWRCGTLYKLRIELDQGRCFDRWFTRESFVRKIPQTNKGRTSQ